MTPSAARNPFGDQFPGILAAAQEGGDWAVAALYRWLHPSLVGYLRARAGDDAEDVAAETWMAIAGGLRGFSGDEGALRSWVFTIAHRRLVDHHRATARRIRTRSLTPGDHSGATDDGPVADPVSPDDPAAETIDALAGDEATRRILSLLPAEQAEIVLLRVVAGLAVDDVARITGRRAGSVRVLQHRALRRLADRLERPDDEL